MPLNPDELEREIQRSWTVNAASWTAAVRDGLIESRRVATNRAVLDAVLEHRPRRVLDVGCGEGWLAHELAAHGLDVVGFDASAPLIDRARTGAGDFHVLTYDDFARDPHKLGGDFNVAVCNFSLLGKEIAPVLNGCASVLGPDGALVIQTVHPFMDALESGYEDGWRREDFRGMQIPFSAAMPWYFRTMSSWVAAVTGAGFTIAELREPIHPETRRPASLLIVARR